MKILFLIAFRDFKDEELFKPYKVLVEGGVEVIIVSSKKGVAIGSEGGDVQVDTTLEDVDLDGFEGLYLIGGTGALKYLNKKIIHELIREADKRKMGLGAICISPRILAESGVLEGKRATVWSSSLDKSAVKILKKQGVEYVEEDVVRDGRIITASGPRVARRFGEKILDFLNQN